MAEDNQVKTVEPFEGPIADPPRPVEVEVKGRPEVVETPRRRPHTHYAEMKDAQPVLAVAANPKRRAGVILNTDATLTIYVLGGAFDPAAQGFPLAPGASLGIGHQEGVFLACPTATDADRASASIYTETET